MNRMEEENAYRKNNLTNDKLRPLPKEPNCGKDDYSRITHWLCCDCHEENWQKKLDSSQKQVKELKYKYDKALGDLVKASEDGVKIEKLEDENKSLREALEKTWKELNIIRARSGVPYDSDGIKSDVDEKYFSSVVDDAKQALADTENK
jgi:hypothetical protein